MSKHRHHKHHSFRVTWDGKTIASVDRVSPLTRLVEVITVRDGWVTEYQASLLEPGARAIAIERLRLENDGWETRF